jgi:hypothetical protein
MMAEQALFDMETGEVQSVSERAIATSARPPVPPVAGARLLAALMAAVVEMPEWVTAEKKGAHNIKYATLKMILERVRPILHKHGIRIRQGTLKSWTLDEGGGSKGRLVPVYTDLIHTESGEVDRTEVEIPLLRMDAQAMGSAITYGRRYSLLAALGITTDEADDDGEGAKARDVTQGIEESAELIRLKKEIDACKDGTDLAEWGEKAKAKKFADKLSPDEYTLLRKHYAIRVHTIMNAPDEEPPKKGKKAE